MGSSSKKDRDRSRERDRGASSREMSSRSSRRRSRDRADRHDSAEPKRKHTKTHSSSKSDSSRTSTSSRKEEERKLKMKEAEEKARQKREKVISWRKMRDDKKNNLEVQETNESVEENGGGEGECAVVRTDVNSSWTLEDENDDVDMEVESESEGANPEQVKAEVGEVVEIDPLDAFMNELAQSNDIGTKNVVLPSAGTKIQILTAPAPSVSNDTKKKGDIIENDDTNYEAVEDVDLASAQQMCLSRGRFLASVDHEKVFYVDFKKDFYIELPELSRITEKEAMELRKSMDDIKAKGSGKIPVPINAWAQCGFNSTILTALRKLNYLKPTPIQAQALPCILSGRDVMGIAKTGSGKTLAFLLPMFRHIKDQAPLDEGDGPIAIIMTPTRELALQIWKEAKKFANLLKLNVVAVYGGVGISEQIADLKRQPEIIVCTPGRMIEMLTANSGKVTNLRRVTYCVLDEADRMFDLGFEPQVMKILANIRPNKQLLLFSATFPKQMDGLARKVLKAPVEIQVGGKSIVCKDVNQNVLIVEEQQKFLKLLELLGIYSQTGSVLVFVEKQEKSEELVNMLIKSNYMAAPLHGGVNQDDRNSTIVDFKSGVLTLMVATSVAARGLDVKNLKLVVNYDCPNHYEDYVHRVGRTGRAGNKGFAYTFIMPEGQEKMAGELVRAFESAGSKAPSELKEMYTKWKKQMKTEGKNTRIGTGGFGGSGFKYDALEDEATINKRRMQKLVLGIENNVMDDDGEIEEQLITMLKSTKTYLEKGAVNSMLVKGGNGNSNSTNEPTPTVSEGKMERAKAAAAKINAAKAPQSEQPTVAPTPSGSTITAPNVMTGSTIQINISAASLAKQKADQLNERLNYVPTENSNLYDLPDNVHFYEEELEINEFPQQVRYKVCSRDSIKQIQEFADVGISVKGSHIIGNREPHAGERKLYLFIEARDEISLRRAKEEILRIMKDAFRQIGAANRGGTQSRYKVV